MHGHKFAIVGRSNGMDREESHDGEVQNALKRDTIQVPGNSKATIRFVADNPGAWMFHCHLEVRVTKTSKGAARLGHAGVEAGTSGVEAGTSGAGQSRTG